MRICDTAAQTSLETAGVRYVIHFEGFPIHRGLNAQKWYDIIIRNNLLKHQVIFWFYNFLVFD